MLAAGAAAGVAVSMYEVKEAKAEGSILSWIFGGIHTLPVKDFLSLYLYFNSVLLGVLHFFTCQCGLTWVSKKHSSS